jgi:PAS domain S-box-containing protein
MSENTTILFVEDSELDFELMLRSLKQVDFKFIPFRATTIPDFNKLINEVKPDIVISDYHLVGFTGFQVIEAFKNTNKDIPLIVVSSNIGEEKAVEALKMGATDYMLKDHIKKLPHVINRALEEWRLKVEREQTLAALRRREQMYSQLLNAMQDGLIQLSPDFEITYANPAFISMLGYTSIEEVIGFNLNEFFIDNNQHITKPVVQLKHNEGLTVFCEISVGDLIDNSNSSALVIKNITAEIEQKKIAKRLNAELDLLIYRIAHDLRGPICSIEGLISVIEDKQEKNWVDLVNKQVLHSYNILDNLRTLVQVRKHKTSLANTSLKTLFNEFKNSFPSITFELLSNIDIIKCDDILLKEALAPIIENALKYKKEHDSCAITIQTDETTESLNIHLTDNGIGIEPNKLNEVLKMFFKASKTSGVGLGLYISKIIIEKLGGKIKITSELGTFTKVSIQLPKQ